MENSITALTYFGSDGEQGVVPLYTYSGFEGKTDVYILVETVDNIGPDLKDATVIKKIFADITEHRSNPNVQTNGRNWSFRLLGYSPHEDKDKFWEIDTHAFEVFDVLIDRDVEAVTIEGSLPTYRSYARNQIVDYLPYGVVMPNGDQLHFNDHLPPAGDVFDLLVPEVMVYEHEQNTGERLEWEELKALMKKQMGIEPKSDDTPENGKAKG